MKWAAICLAACAIIVLSAPSIAQVNPFEDVPKDHWGYKALDNLQQKKILMGYPDGKFRGGRVITRFEFAFAMKRALEAIGALEGKKGDPGDRGDQGPTGPAGEKGPQGGPGPAGLTPSEIANFRQLSREFREDLSKIGVNMAAADRQLGKLEIDVAGIASDLAKRPHIYGATWLGLRSANADGSYVDADGRFTPQLGQQFPRYDFLLGIDVPVGGLSSMPKVPLDTGNSKRLNPKSGLALALKYINSNLSSRDPFDLNNALNPAPPVQNPFANDSSWRYIETMYRRGYTKGLEDPGPTRAEQTIANGGAYLNTIITANNLREYYSGNFATILPLKPNPASDVYLQQFVLTTPFNPVGKNGVLNLGRQPIAISPLTLWKPPNDTYFEIPWYNDGSYIMDGFKINTSFPNCIGSLNLTAFAGQFSSVRGNKGPAWNSPIAGVDNFGLFGQPLFIGGNKPVGQIPGFSGAGFSAGAITVDQLAGITLGLNVRQLHGGAINFSALDMSGHGQSGYGTPAGGFNGLFVLGSNFNVPVTPQISFTGDWAKTITHTGRQTTINPHQNNAFNAGLGYSSGGLNVKAGYRYIDPLFYAPGYWNKIGNWYNPTNIQGPTIRIGYDFNPAFGVTIGGDFFSGARNKAITTIPSNGGLSTDDDIHRILAGLRWDVAKNFQTTIDWEGVYWTFSGTHTGIPGLGTGTIHPTEHYITLGTGYNLTSNTLLKMSYQIGTYNGHGLGMSGMGSNNYNTFISQVGVKF